MKQLIHNGILIPAAYAPKGVTLQFRGETLSLSPLQEEMVVKFAQKFGTPYVEDGKFCDNFMRSFAKALGIKGWLKKDDFDWTPIVQMVEQERQRKANMTKEERKAQAQQRKQIRETNKAKYGSATVDGQQIPLGSYMVEPSGIFMGRGKHPNRGKWKQGATTKDVILNLSPDAPMPPGEWKGREWHPEEMWVAKWTDRLSRKVKYVWFHDTSPMKQERAQEKFDLASTLDNKIGAIRQHISAGLTSEAVKRRKVATVAYLIDKFQIRVGDEEETESGTVGATSLKSEHIKLLDGLTVELNFLGKDSVLFSRSLEISPEAYNNLKAFASNGSQYLFEGIRTEDVREFLSEAMPKLSPKVFRTFSATQLFKQELEKAGVRPNSDAIKKKLALVRANAEVAKLLNHQKAPPKGWKEVYDKRQAKLKELRGKDTKTAEKRKGNLKIRIEEMRLTKTWNLGTSLRNYIDPRAVIGYCKQINYDWHAYYPKTLAAKFSWAENQKTEKADDASHEQ